MALYTFSIDGLALVAATAKSVLELGTPATDRAKITRWWVEFDGVTATAVPVKVEVGMFSAGVTTATTGTAQKQDCPEGPAPQSVIKHSTTVEGAGTAGAGIEVHRIHPQGGLVVQAPLGREGTIPVSGFWRIRCTAAAGVNVTAGVEWEE